MPEAATRSLCPECLQVLPAVYVQEGAEVFLRKTCPEHGVFQTIVWRGEPAFAGWLRPKTPVPGHAEARPAALGCPRDCGLCANHRQHTCCAVVEITQRCDLGCPVCYAASGSDAPADPDLTRLGWLLDRLKAQSGDCVVQLSGGEPCVRDDLPAIVALCKAKGFSFVQINTNGLRLAREPDFARRLAEAGADTIYLQFDSLDDAPYVALRGRPLRDTKLRAVDAAAAARLGVVLVATVVLGVNDGHLGALLRFAVANGPAVRGLHLQPVSYFGRMLSIPEDAQRITLPELMRGLETQTAGLVHAADCIPPGCEHALCSFHASYIRRPDGSLRLVSTPEGCCGPASAAPAAEGARKAKDFTRRQWAFPEDTPEGAEAAGEMDRFLADARRRAFSLSAMAFQDAWTMDLERLQGCCIHVLSPDGRLIPFCSYNCTSRHGQTLHRGVKA
ncbi:radical SAM (seleno)protein TrsS [Megalodesulfovibrio gigas]|uniref:Putative Radical SAM domain protein n=1 Tax=Megalodesulfovibrio gigas (strain ATCC 19364 / DSM 1382 / NCIMB 9332 / VKM B-1759) TaxID=1121448 RepID=T2G9E6_MEGG1|nr:radical SAM (seleno)protein TrsS [Megalodesulfovibrio gigas]AGW12799.1 putative Radical SAM domain protein [Megalodesulfovibrio gigas DSM 1382 = ATCC 19364]